MYKIHKTKPKACEGNSCSRSKSKSRVKEAMNVAYLSKSQLILKLPFTCGMSVGDCSQHEDLHLNIKIMCVLELR